MVASKLATIREPNPMHALHITLRLTPVHDNLTHFLTIFNPDPTLSRRLGKGLDRRTRIELSLTWNEDTRTYIRVQAWLLLARLLTRQPVHLPPQRLPVLPAFTQPGDALLLKDDT
jgi:hypothetical protein